MSGKGVQMGCVAYGRKPLFEQHCFVFIDKAGKGSGKKTRATEIGCCWTLFVLWETKLLLCHGSVVGLMCGMSAKNQKSNLSLFLIMLHMRFSVVLVDMHDSLSL